MPHRLEKIGIRPIVSRRRFGCVVLLVAGLAGAGAQAAEPILQLDTGGPMGLVRSLIVTPGGSQLISASDDKVIRIWDLGSGRTTQTLRGEIGEGDAGKIYALALSPDGRLLAAGGRTGTRDSGDHPIRLYDMANGEIVGLLSGHRDAILSLDFSSDGRLLASGSVDDTAIVWDMQRRQPARHLVGHRGDVNAVRFALDGAGVITAGDDGSVRVWSLRTGAVTAAMTEHSDKVVALAVSPRDGLVASGGLDKTIRLWDPGGRSPSRVLAKQDTEIMSLAFSRDGARLLSGSGSKPFEAHVWDAASGASVVRYTGHDNIVLATAFTPNGAVAVTGGGDNNEIHLWEAATGHRAHVLAGQGRPVWSVAFSKDGRMLAWGTERRAGGTMNAQGPLSHVLRLPTVDRPMGEPRTIDADGESFMRAVTSLGGLTLRHRAGGDYGYYANLDIVADGRPRATIVRDETDGYAHNAYTFTPDGRTIIAGAGHGFLTAFDTAGRKLGAFVGHTSDVWAVAVSPDGRWLLSGSDDQTVRLWNVATRENVVTLFHGRGGDWVVWMPQGYYAASPEGDGRVGWQINEGRDRAARFVAAAQLKRHFYRPDIVTRALVLGSARRAEAETQTTRFALGELANRRPPDFQIAALSRTVEQSPVTIRLDIAANPDPVLAFDVTVNGRRVLSQVLPEGDVARGQAGGQSLTVPLASGDNRIEIAALNNVGRTLREVALLNRGREDLDRRGVLHIVAIGVDEYVNFGQDLKFAGADARGFSRLLMQRAAPLYREVRGVVLAKDADRPPTARNVLDALDTLRKAGPDDTVVLFLAGHGINHGADYLFLPSDAAFDGKAWSPDSVVTWQRLQETLEGTRGRRIMLVDTCHSGNAFNARLVKDAADARVIVFAATDAETLAQERPALGHGVFTHAVLEGLKGNADLVPDRLVKVQELSAFVDRLVRTLTDGKQQPTFHFTGTSDYVLTRF